MLTFALLTVAMASAAQNSPMSASSADVRKAEPNSQAPASPQADSSPSANVAGSPLGQPEPAANAALRGRIQDALRNEPTLSASHVSVNVTDSTIELSGTAASSMDKETAERIAESFDGNRKFVDKLMVTGQASIKNETAKPSATTGNPQH